MIDIILPIYKANEKIFESIDSIINQTYKDWHLTIIDDASKDGMLQNIKNKYRNHNNKISYIKIDKNLRAAGARNYAVSKTTGEYIAFIDQDDIWMPQKLEKQIQLFDNKPDVGASHTDIKILDENNNGTIIENLRENHKRSQIDWEGSSKIEMAKIVFSNYPMRMVTTIVKREIYELIGGYNEKLFGSEDLELWLRIAEKCKIGYIPEQLAIRRRHNNNVTKIYKFIRHKGYLEWVMKLRNNNDYSYLKKIISIKEKQLLKKTYDLALLENYNKEALILALKSIIKYPFDIKNHCRIVYHYIKFLFN